MKQAHGTKNICIGNYIKNRTVAIEMTPTTTVIDKLFVQSATIIVGMNAAKTGQSIDTMLPSVSSKFSITSALKIQTGI